MKSLDVGCGNIGRGDVNCDLFISPTLHREDSIDCQSIKNFVQCDALHLPFADNTFDIIYATAILEHLERPLDTLKEWSRVAPRLYVAVPCLEKHQAPDPPSHLYSWSMWSLENLLKKVYRDVQVRCRGVPLMNQFRIKNITDASDWQLKARYLVSGLYLRMLFAFLITRELVAIAQNPIHATVSEPPRIEIPVQPMLRQ